jgi:hypothetical protein
MKSIAQASAWVRFTIGDRPEGAAEDLRHATPQNSSAPSGQDVIKKGPQGKPRVNPGLCFQGPSGRRYCTKQSVHFVYRPVRTAPRPGMRAKEQCVNRNILVVSQATIAHPPPTSMAHPCSPLAPLGERGLAITRSPSSRRSARRDC